MEVQGQGRGAADGRRMGRTPPEGVEGTEGDRRVACLGYGLCTTSEVRQVHKAQDPSTPGKWRSEVEGNGGGTRRSQSQVKVTGHTGHGSAAGQVRCAERTGCRNSVCWIPDIPCCPGSVKTSETSGQATGWCVVRVIGGRNTRTV